MENKTGYTIHVVSHTHWDREWRYPFQIYRSMLVNMVDGLIEILEENPKFKHFLFDSQCIAFEDYLDIRPEKEKILRTLVESGRIQIGPWYTLPDTPPVSGESLIRNLLLGSIYTEDWKGRKWSGYSPFSFGQSSQTPQIYKGFDLDHIFFYRGNNNRITKNEFLWEAPDGSRIMGMRSINPYGRANWYVHVYRPLALNKWPSQWDYSWNEDQVPFRPCDESRYKRDYIFLKRAHLNKLHTENLPKALDEIKKHAAKDATSNNLLYLDGMDQSNVYPRTPEIIDLANNVQSEDIYKHSTFYDYVQAVKENSEPLKLMKGEFRYTMVDGLWQNLFPGMLCARMELKQQNRDCEQQLQKNADLWACIAELLGAEYPEGLLEKAWKYHLANQSHDSIAGCGVDVVYEDVEYRNRQVSYIAEDITFRSHAEIVSKINIKNSDKNSICLSVFNPSNYKRSEVITACIDIPAEMKASWFIVEDEKGNEYEVQFFGNKPDTALVNDPYDFPAPFEVCKIHCAVYVKDIPALGYKTLIIKPQKGIKRNTGSLSPALNTLENEFIKATIESDGRITLYNKINGKCYRGLHYFEDRSDVGDHATQKAVKYDEIITNVGAPVEVTQTHDGVLSAGYKIRTTLELPIDALSDGSRRNSHRPPYTVLSYVSLSKGSPFLEIETEINNTVKDHKFRVMFPSGYSKAMQSFSESHFAVTRRDIQLPDTSSWKEPMLPYYPQYMFCGIEDDGSGLAILNRGLPEYAVHDDRERTIGLTLLRTYRFPIIGADPEQVGYDETQIMCQCQRKYSFQYAVYPYEGKWETGKLFEYAHRFNIPLKLNQSGITGGNLPAEMSFIDISPDTLVLSAVKKSSRNNSLIVRIFNPMNKEIHGRITFFRSIEEAYLVQLNEKRLSELPCEENSLTLNFGPHKIVTVEAVLRRGMTV